MPRAWRPAPLLCSHALKNAAVPIVTVIGIGIALLIGGVVITETVFNIPGIGRLVGRCHLAARLPDHPRRDHAVLRRLRAGESAGRPVLHAVRPADPVLTWSLSPRSPRRRPCPASRAVRVCHCGATQPSSSARRAGLMAAVGAASRPMIAGDPHSMVPAEPAAATLGGALVRHRPARPRRVRPPVYGARISLVVGLSVAGAVGRRSASSIGLAAGYLPPARQRASCASWTG